MPRKPKNSWDFPQFYQDICLMLQEGKSGQFQFDSIGEANGFRFRFYDYRRALAREDHALKHIANSAVLRIKPGTDGKAWLIVEDGSTLDLHLEAQIRSQRSGRSTMEEMMSVTLQELRKRGVVEIESQTTQVALQPEPPPKTPDVDTDKLQEDLIINILGLDRTAIGRGEPDGNPNEGVDDSNPK